MNYKSFKFESEQERLSLWLRAPHDLRQSIQSLVLWTEVLARTDDLAKRRQTAELMENLLVGLQSMLDQLAKLARFDAGIENPLRQRCELPKLFQRIATENAALVGTAGMSLRVSNTRSTLICDVELLAIMLTGLVQNGIKLSSGQKILLAYRPSVAGDRIEVYYQGQPVEAGQGAGVFIESPHQLEDQAGAVAAGLGLIARLAQIIGGNLECRSLSRDLQRLRLTLPADASCGGRAADPGQSTASQSPQPGLDCSH